MDRLLIVGAGATIEECQRSGNFPEDESKLFPTIKNFCRKFFNPLSDSLYFATALFLTRVGVPFERKLIKAKEGQPIVYERHFLDLRDGQRVTAEDIALGPLGTFLTMEQGDPEVFNIERLAELAWTVMGPDEMFWLDFANSGIYNRLQWLFYDQFGSGIGKPMRAGTKVAQQLRPDDVVINLNYDVAFDLALKQAGKTLSYAPHFEDGAIHLLKPHGSINLYYNHKSRKSFFSEPDKMAGSVSVDMGAEGIFDPFGGLLPPRLNKNYRLHPLASAIIDSVPIYNPSKMTFWGIGLTESDVDLTAIYKDAARSADSVEFINPDRSASQKAALLLGCEVRWFETLGDWLRQYDVSYP